MDCSDSPPRRASKSRHIPAEITEEILLKVPVKSLLRFSSVSRSWNLMINDARFSKKYRGRENMIMSDLYCGGGSFKTYPLSTIVSNYPIEEAATDLAIVKFNQIAGALTITAVCDGLCFLEHQISLSLLIWNPSIRKFHQLPSSPFPTAHQGWVIGHCVFHYGLGFDAVGDDYKLLRICYNEAALYSLKSDSWRKIQSFPEIYMPSTQPSWFVSGAMHWLCYHKMSGEYAVVSFDSSTEEFGEVALPMHYEIPNLEEVVVLRGKLCWSLNYAMERRFVLWVMEDYGVAESWTKKFDVGYDVFGSHYVHPWLRPLCTCDDDDDDDDDGRMEAICVTNIPGHSWVVWKDRDGNTLVKKNFCREAIYREYGFVYVESLVSPPALVTSQQKKD